MVLGCAFGMVTPLQNTLVQMHAPIEVLGRVNSVMNAGFNGAGALPLFAAPALAAIFGVQDVLVGASLAVDAALTVGLKYAVGRERPYDRYPGMLQVPYPEGSPSMPSGHTSLAFATATALTLRYPRWYVAVPCYAWACSVGYSRMNLGVHYPTDVLAGAVLGAGSAYVTHLLNEWFWKEKMKDKKIIWY